MDACFRIGCTRISCTKIQRHVARDLPKEASNKSSRCKTETFVQRTGPTVPHGDGEGIRCAHRRLILYVTDQCRCDTTSTERTAGDDAAVARDAINQVIARSAGKRAVKVA